VVRGGGVVLPARLLVDVASAGSSFRCDTVLVADAHETPARDTQSSAAALSSHLLPEQACPTAPCGRDTVGPADFKGELYD